MHILEEYIAFVKDQATYHEHQVERLARRNKTNNDRLVNNHRRVGERLRELQEFLESLPSDIGERKKQKVVSPSLHLTPDDLEGLPQEILDELNMSESDMQEIEILRALEHAGGMLPIHKLIIQLYRDTGNVHSRRTISAKLYRMTQKGQIESVPHRKGVYALPGKSNGEENEKPAAE